MALNVLAPGWLTTVQDLGRFGVQRFGVPPSGAMDPFAFRAANALVGNLPEAAGVEFSLEAPVFQADEDCLVAAAGRGFNLRVQDRRVGLWRAAWVRRGEQVHFMPEGSGGWAYLCVSGGIEAPLVMGSRSTYLRGRFGGLSGRLLQVGDRLPVGQPFVKNLYELAGRWLPPQDRPAYADAVRLGVVLGPQQEAFTAAGLETFLSGAYQVSSTSDRMGYRLAGPPVTHRASPEILSEGMVFGSVQIPPDHQPIVMMADHPTTGGYPKIATLARVSIPLLAQCPPGAGRVRFEAITADEARAAYRAQLQRLDQALHAW